MSNLNHNLAKDLTEEANRRNLKNSSALWISEKPNKINNSIEVDIPEIVKKETENENKSTKGFEDIPAVSFISLFQYSSFNDRLLIVIGNFAGLLAGVTNPAIIILLGWMLDTFVKQQQDLSGDFCDPKNQTIESVFGNSSNPSQHREQPFLASFLKKSEQFALGMAGISIGQLFLSFIIVYTLSRSAENQALRIRQKFMRAILRQNIGWFDTNETGDFASRITADLVKLQDGIGDKLGICVYFYSTTVVSIGVALFFGWQLTLVILSIMPVLVASSAIIAKIQAKVAGDEMTAYGNAGAVAEEVLSSIRTVTSFSGQSKEIIRYDQELNSAKISGVKRGLLTSIGMALVWFIIYASYALAFWYGSDLVLADRCTGGVYNASTLVIVFFSVLTGAMFIGQTAPYMESFATARGAAAKIFHIIEKIPPIDASSELGEKPEDFIGNVKFENISFQYPARPDVQILRNFSLEAVPGETVALVGSSGCGKSTIIQLLQRFYDVEDGQIFLDGRDLKALNVGWLRDQIGVVGQEPCLFANSIYENIRYGFSSCTEDDIINAAKSANAHEFILNLPLGYKTLVGERGTQLSGGQKQRIAIARALVRNPKILLLDEATSALDMESESVVQSALDEARKGRTTLVVAHRLSTIQTANKIVAVENGFVKEFGSHDDLMAAKGLYYKLVTAQSTESSDGDDTNFDAFQKELDLTKNDVNRHMSITSTMSGEASLMPLHRHSSAYRINKEKIGNVEISDDVNPPPKAKLLKMAAPEWKYILVGCISSALMGLSIPIYGIIFGDILTALNKEESQARKETNFYSLLFLMMGVASGIAVFLQTFMFTIAGECLTMRLRKLVFTNMLRQEISWFDLPENGTGALCSRLSADAAHVQGATGSRVSTILQALTTLLASIAIALFYNYKIGLVVLSFVPLVLLATFLESRVVSGHLIDEKAAFESATKIAIEAIENIRTVVSLHQEDTFYTNYTTELAAPHKKSRKKSLMRGFTFGISQCTPNLAYGIAMYYGATLIAKGELNYGNLFKVLEGIILGCMMIGQAVAFAPDYHRAKVSANRIFKLLEKKSEIDSLNTNGIKPTDCKGEVNFHRIHFRYPTRDAIEVLQGLNLTSRPGETIALVGSSGCGKSTCIQLLQRFYDISQGDLKIDGINIRDLDVNWLRSQMGLVSQEPVLFGFSISENIAYGDNSRTVTIEEIIQAAKKANIHNFIQGLPEGYNTNVGDRGTQLSGGQKQRIAIARALVRNPKILLLDEATSALDTESEKVVQEALENARTGRTCIVIAHRLSTIQNADRIVVIYKGKVVESGTHTDLLGKKGFYYKLNSIQGA